MKHGNLRISPPAPRCTIAPLISLAARGAVCAILAVMVAGLLTISAAQAAITSTGNFDPADPAAWNNSTEVYIGYDTGDGHLTVDGGSSVSSDRSYLGFAAGIMGTATITGPGSTWTSSSARYVGYNGTGVLNVTDGAAVTNSSIIIGYKAGSAGTVNVSGPASTLTTSNNIGVGYDGFGVLNITSGGTVTSPWGMRLGSSSTGIMNISGTGSKLTVGHGGNNVFDIGYMGNGIISVTNGGTLISDYLVRIGFYSTASVVNVDGAGSSWMAGGAYGFHMGEDGRGTLNITNGGTVTTNAGDVMIAGNEGTLGTINIDGPGSTWNVTSSGPFYLGRLGTATVNVTNGGKVISKRTSIIIGHVADSGGGSVTVNGTGSSWSHKGAFDLGGLFLGTGRLNISDGATVTADALSINPNSTLTLDLGKGSALTVSGTGIPFEDAGGYSHYEGAGRLFYTGRITNNGTIRLVAGASATSGTYAPINAHTWMGSGAVQALGGVWDSAAHTVTVSDAALAFAGRATGIDLASAQRMLFVDPATAQVAGMSFLGATTSTPITVNASVMSAAVLSALRGILALDENILSGWNFTTTGYASGNPVYLSLYAGPDHGLSGLNVWHYDGSTWSAFTANDLAYDGTYASFTVTDFSGYAVSGTAPVPIPAAVWLLGSGLAGLIGIRKRMRKKAS